MEAFKLFTAIRARRPRYCKAFIAEVILLFLLLFLTACSAASAQPPAVTPSLECATPETIAASSVCLPTQYASPPTQQPTGSEVTSPTSIIASTPDVTASSFSPTLSPASTLQTDIPTEQLSPDPWLARPVAAGDNDQIDTSYRFGSTQGKKRDPHHGVEFLNPQGTPILAAADGVVVFAGDDKKELFSRYYNYYGNLVVIEHDPPEEGYAGIPDFPMPLFTLYAHLSEISVQAGQRVRQGQEIGKVGMTGGATGSHLHFEVRLGENKYAASSNPELWLTPSTNENGQPGGMIAGRVVADQNRQVAVKGIVIQHLVDGPQSSVDWEIYLDSYEEKALIGRPPWQESFAAGNLPAGWYRISFPYYGLQQQVVQVLPGQVTEAVFQVE